MNKHELMCQLVSFNHASWRTYGQGQASCLPLTQSSSYAKLIIFSSKTFFKLNYSTYNFMRLKPRINRSLYSTEAEVK